MNVATLLNIFGLKHTKDLVNDEQIKKLVEFINENHIEYTDIEKGELSDKAFISFLHTINTISDAAYILMDYRNIRYIETEPVETALFYNIYSYKEFLYPGKYVASLLTDEEYLSYALPEWTRGHILDFSFNKILSIEGDNISVKDNILTEENEEEFEPSMYKNVEQLYIAKQNNMLQRAIESLSN